MVLVWKLRALYTDATEQPNSPAISFSFLLFLVMIFCIPLFFVVNNSRALGLFLSEFDAKVWAKKKPHNFSLQRLFIVRKCSEMFRNVREIKKSATPTWQNALLRQFLELLHDGVNLFICVCASLSLIYPVAETIACHICPHEPVERAVIPARNR